MPGESGIKTLIRFARLAVEAGRDTSTLPMLADALVADVGAGAVAMLEIEQGGTARFVPSPHLPKALESLPLDPDMIGAELGQQLLEVCGREFREVHARPLVSRRELFGLVFMFFSRGCSVERLALAEALTDMAAIALENVAKLDQLAKSHAELRASQDRLVRSEKLRALGEMAAGVSHDLKNILNPLSLHLQLAQRRIGQGKPEDAKRSLADMAQVLTRGVQTIDRLREYGRQSREPRPDEEVELGHLAREASEIARPRMSARGVPVRYVLELDAPARVRGLPGEIVSALVNLIVNAVDAMKHAGTITLRTGRSEAVTWVEVVDDGPGMSPEVERRVFEPFFTTKGDEGTGLGLAMVYSCMQRHGGSVKLTTAEGQGTTFRLCFPALGAPAPQPAGD